MPHYVKCCPSDLPKHVLRLAILAEIQYDIFVQVRNVVRHDADYPCCVGLDELLPRPRYLCIRASAERTSATLFAEPILDRELLEIHDRLRTGVVKLWQAAACEETSHQLVAVSMPNMRARQSVTLTPLVAKMLTHAQSLDDGQGVHALRSQLNRKFNLHGPHGFQVLHDLGLLWINSLTHQTFVAKNVKVTVRELPRC